jgi:hypothetical protein
MNCEVPNSKFSAFASSFGATASKRSEDGQIPEKLQAPSRKMARRVLEFEIWSFFGVWNLEFGTYVRG